MNREVNSTARSFRDLSTSRWVIPRKLSRLIPSSPGTAPAGSAAACYQNLAAVSPALRRFLGRAEFLLGAMGSSSQNSSGTWQETSPSAGPIARSRIAVPVSLPRPGPGLRGEPGTGHSTTTTTTRTTASRAIWRTRSHSGRRRGLRARQGRGGRRTWPRRGCH